MWDILESSFSSLIHLIFEDKSNEDEYLQENTKKRCSVLLHPGPDDLVNDPDISAPRKKSRTNIRIINEAIFSVVNGLARTDKEL